MCCCMRHVPPKRRLCLDSAIRVLVLDRGRDHNPGPYSKEVSIRNSTRGKEGEPGEGKVKSGQ